MAERGIDEADVRRVLETGEVIAEYPDDVPFPSRLVLGRSGIRPLHVVACDNDAEQATIVITVYVPGPDQWEPDFRTRRTR